MKSWSEVESSQQYQLLPDVEKQDARQQYFDKVIRTKPEFQKLSGEEQAAASGQFFRGKESESLPDSIATKGIGYTAQHPFLTQFQPLAKTITGESLEEKAKKHVMSEKFTRPPADAPFDRNLKNINPIASLEVGYAQNADLLSSPINAFGGTIAKAGGEAIGLGVKALEGMPKLAGDVSARIHNNLVRLPTKAFNYSKDPLDVFKKENIVANSISEYADKAKGLLEQRTGELNNAVASSKKTVDVSGVMDKHFKDAVSSAKGSLQDRTAILEKLDYMKKALTKQYGDLTNLPVQKAVKLYRQLADDFPFSGNAEENIMAKTAHKMYHDIGAAVDTAHPEVADLNHRVSGLIDITKAAQNRMAVESRNNPVGLIGTILGTAAGVHGGGIVGGIEGGVATALALKAVSSPAVMTRIAKALSIMSTANRAKVAKAFPILQKKAPELFTADLGKVGELYQEPIVTKRPEPFVRTSQSEWPSSSPLTQEEIYSQGEQKVLNNPVSGEFNPIKSQGKARGKVMKAVVGGALSGSLAMGSAQAAENVDMNKIYQIESSGNPEAKNSKSGAVGLGQITPIVLKEWNNMNPKQQHTSKYLTDAKTNMKIADWYMNKRIPQMLKAKGLADTTKNRLVAYNAGISHVGKSIMPKETYNYIEKYNKK